MIVNVAKKNLRLISIIKFIILDNTNLPHALADLLEMELHAFDSTHAEKNLVKGVLLRREMLKQRVRRTKTTNIEILNRKLQRITEKKRLIFHNLRKM